MAGPQDIQRLPKGLVDLLGMRATGDTAHYFSNEVAGSLDLLDMYLLDRHTAWSSNPAAAAGAVTIYPLSILPDRPPPGELWLVYEASLVMGVIAAASTLDVAFVVSRTSQTGAVATSYLTPMLKLVASTGGMVTGTYTKPVILQPGDVLGVQVFTVTGVPGIIPKVNMLYARLAY
jgi:hypothetical protein